MKPVDIVIHPCQCVDCFDLDEPVCFAEAPCDECSECIDQREAERDKYFNYLCDRGLA